MRRKRKLQEVPKQCIISITYLDHIKKADLNRSILNYSEIAVNLKTKGQSERK